MQEQIRLDDKLANMKERLLLDDKQGNIWDISEIHG